MDTEARSDTSVSVTLLQPPVLIQARISLHSGKRWQNSMHPPRSCCWGAFM
ncbi:hypothetical protein SynBIOSE41_01377 [Synechococcus sp. BIOS-E4-1]|nr:hypothetical protein SynBIOSE41_01377 [Synechococcus sp. BIOS-E4-1]